MNPETTTDWLGVIAAWITALAALGTVLLTAGLLWAAWRAYRTASGTLKQMREDSEAQREDSARATRPYVYARIVPGLAGERTWDLTIENSGRTAAYDLQVSIKANEVRSDVIATAVRRFASAGTMVPPGARIRTFWSMPANPKASPPEAMGFPRAEIALTYTDSDHLRFEDRAVVLDSDDLGLTPAPTVDTEAPTRENSGVETVKALRAIARHVGESAR